MKKVIDSALGEIVYEEGFWTGKKQISVNGESAVKQTKTTFLTAGGTELDLRGNFFSGVQLQVGDKSYEIIPKSQWYEYVLSVVPLLFILIWGNVPALVAILPVVGGAIGGLIGGLFFALNLLFVKKTNVIWQKLLITLCSFIVAVLICMLIAFALIALI